MSPRVKKIAVRGCLGCLGVVVLLVVAGCVLVYSWLSPRYEGEMAGVFPAGALAYVEAPDLETTGPALLLAWDQFAASRLYRDLAADRVFAPFLVRLPGDIARARTEIPEALAQVPGGLELGRDLIGRGCAAAVYPPLPAPAAPAAAPGAGAEAVAAAAPAAPPASPLDGSGWLVATRVGKPIRLASHLVDWVPAGQVPADVQVEPAPPGWRIHAKGREPVFVAVLADLLVASNRAELLAGADALVGATLAGESLATDRRFAAAAAAEPPGPEPVRGFVDVDRLDALVGVRRSARVRFYTWPMNIFGEFVNAYQDLLLELPLVSAIGASVDVAADGTLSVRAAVVTDPSRAGAALARPGPGEPGAMHLAPAATAGYATVRLPFRTVWERILACPIPEVRENLEQNLQHFKELLDAVVPHLAEHATVVFGAPPADAPADAGILPPFAAIFACTDEVVVTQRATEILDKYRERFATRYPDERAPQITSDELAGGRYVYVHFPVMPKMLAELGPDFSPGVLFIGQSAILVTTRAFARELAAALQGGVPRLREQPEFQAGLLGAGGACSAAIHFDLGAAGRLLTRIAPRWSEEISAVDWDAENARLRAAGTLPNSPEWHAAQQRRIAEAQRQQAVVRGSLEQRARLLALGRSLSATSVVDDALPGYRAKVRLRVDLAP